MRSRLSLILCVFGLMALAGCGGGDGGEATPPPTSNNPPPPPPPPPVIGAGGGTVTEASGASVIVPAGALTTDTTIRIAMDSTGAPTLPAGLIAAGNAYAITPHGGEFAQPVEVRLPAPNVTLQPNQTLKLAKAQPDGEWEVLDGTTLTDGILQAKVSSFSFFRAIVINYSLPIAQALPIDATSTLDCAEQSCDGAIIRANVTYTVVSNNGQFPENCENGSLILLASLGYFHVGGSIDVPRTGGVLRETAEQNATNTRTYFTGVRCNGYSVRLDTASKVITWAWPLRAPALTVMRIPAQIDVVEGLTANLDVVLGGGGAATPADRAIVDWQRSDDGGTSWRAIARSYQGEGNPVPARADIFWSARYGFIATATDQGALIRVHVCYTPPVAAAPPCVFSAATRISVLQQSALPAIVNAPRSMLVRAGQTASLSASASGLPAPTLQWQTRAANSTDAWSDVTTGTGPTTVNYTTAAMALADNGVQYRVVATNAVGSTASVAVTVSVSDLDVAPSITTQPANLNVASGSDAVFAIDARGTEALSYQWYRNGAALAGANGPVLRLTGVTVLNSGSFSVRVSNSAGNADSNSATLNVYPGAPAEVAPTIVTQPAAVTVNVGNTATFAVGVDGSGPFTFQWRKDDVDIAGATSAVLSFSNVTASAAGSYSVVVSNAVSTGVTSSPAILTVTPGGAAEAPTITTQPATLIVAPGGAGILAVAATGSGPLSYEWLHDGVPMGGETSAVLFIDNADESAVGRYAVRVSNSLGAVVSTEVQVILLGTPVITEEPVAATRLENETATFSVMARGTALRHQWLLNGQLITGANQASYTTTPLVAANSGAVYSVIVYNNAGLALSQSAVLTVLAFTAPRVLQHPVNTSVDPGSAATLCAAFGGTPPFTVQMTRWSGAAWLPVLAARLLYDNAQACTTTPVLQLNESGAQFRFEAASGPGLAFTAITNPATITVTGPVITATTLASRATSGATANNRSTSPSISADGKVVAFKSDGTNLVPGFTNPGNGYVRNLQTGVTTAVNQLPNGAEPSGGVVEMKLAAGGRYVVFSSMAPGIVADDTNNSQDVFLRDLQTGVTEQITVLADGSQLNGRGNGVAEMHLDISADGRYVIFSSFYDFSSTGGTYPRNALFLRDTVTDQTRTIVANATYNIAYAALASGGEFVAYTLSIPAPATAMVSVLELDSGISSAVFTLDQASGADYFHQGLSISGNGRFVAFPVRSLPLLGTPIVQVVVIDRNDPATLMIASSGTTGSEISTGDRLSTYPKLSDDGRYVTFASMASNISGNVGNSLDWALMVRDLQARTTAVASRRANGTPVRTATGVYNSHVISGDGSVVGFTAAQGDIGDGNIEYQVYVAPRP